MSMPRLDFVLILHIGKIISIFLLVLWFLTGVYGLTKQIPEGVNYQSKVYQVAEDDVSFLYDVTYVNEKGIRVAEQHIFDEIFDMIEGAQNYILLDMFLYNEFKGSINEQHRNLSSELTTTLIDKKNEVQSIEIVVITDPINEVYGGHGRTQLDDLRDAGIQVIVTDLEQLRDSNFLYSGLYNVFFQWFGNGKGGLMPHPFVVGERVSLRTYLKLLNFKANHRKVIMTDDGSDFVSLVTSANPHDGSSAHTNVAVKLRIVFSKMFSKPKV